MSNQYPSFLLLSRLQSELNRLFAEFREFDESNLEEGEWSPRIDVVESSEALILLAEVPGVSAGDLKLEISGNLVTLSGSKRVEDAEESGVQHRKRERLDGRFVRKIQLMRPVNTLMAKARLSDGLLTISFPKVEDQRQKVRMLEIHEERSDD